MQYEPENTVLLAGPGEMERVLERPGAEFAGPSVRWGRPGVVLWLMLGVAAAEGCLLFYEPGAGIGAYGLSLLGILLISRQWTRLSEWQAGGIVLFVASTCQSILYTSMSNILVMGTLLLLLSGERAHGGGCARWQAWLEGMLSGLRPLGTMLQMSCLMRRRETESTGYAGRIWHSMAVALPVVILLVVFGILLGGGNAILGQWFAEGFAILDRWLYEIELPSFERCMVWGFFGMMALILVCPAAASKISGRIAGKWGHLGIRSGKLRLHQWMAILISMNLLFLMSSITDVMYLWMSRELPEGVTHSRYLHKGVYALVLTTLLSAFILGTLTQHTDRIRKNRIVRGLAYLWMGQNLILISGVFLRLWIYVDAYGYTPKRIYVSLFLFVVMSGYTFLGWAIARYKDFKWLVGMNLVLVFGYFLILQFIDVRWIVVELNKPLYAAGEIDYPESLHLSQIGSHAIPYLLAIHENPRSREDRDLAFAQLTTHCVLYTPTDWQSFQYRDHRNHQILERFMRARPEELQ